MRYARICMLLAASRCYAAGQTVAQIAEGAKKSPSTIRRWLRQAGAL
jgi:transposase